MKIIHCADIHLDANLTNPDVDIKQKNREIRNTFLRMLEFATRQRVRAIIIAGDLFDSDRISEETRRILLQNIKKRHEIQFYYLRGNHDTNILLDDGNIPVNLFFFSDSLKIYKTLLTNGRFISISGLETQKMDSKQIGARIALHPKDFNIVCLHGQLREYGGKTGEFSIKDLEYKNIHYLALGHVHKFQKGKLAPNGMYAYSGCLEGRGFDDTGEHGFILLDINEDTFSYTFQFVRFANRNVGSITVDVSNLSTYDAILHSVRVKAEQAGLRKTDLLKVELIGEVFEPRMELDYLEQDLLNFFSRVKVNQCITRRKRFEELRYDISLRGEFFRMVEADPSLDAKKKQQILDCGMRLFNGEY